jgi:3-hydroxyisobutyrate dehydrogenase-like beta-hydroxyacid dehydrogenase
MNEPVGFIGLGNLGLPIANNLLDAGHALTVWNRTREKANPLAEKGARVADRPVDVVTPGGVVVSLLWDTSAVEEVVNTDRFLERLGPGGIHVVMCTGAPEAAARLAALHARHGCHYVEATIFGLPEAAVAKKLWIPMAGARAAKERVRPLLTDMGAQGVFDFGEQVGAATVVKLAGNFLIMSAARSLSEALHMTTKNGLDAQAVVDMFTQTLFPSPVYKGYGTLVARGTTSFDQPEIQRKDIALFEAAAGDGESGLSVASTLQRLID